MDEAEAFRFLNSFADLEKLSTLPENSFFNLKRMEYLFRISGYPNKTFFPILITGTAGKGSTGFFLESILEANGIKTGYYHSPHVESPKERIRLNGKSAEAEFWIEGLTFIKKLLNAEAFPAGIGQLTYFEVLTFLAVWIFYRSKVKIGIFEIGLGGRLDATNAIFAPLVILTRIHLDHEAFLGRTIKAIAKEKSGIIKKQNAVILAPQFPEVFKIIKKISKKNEAEIFLSEPVKNISLGLPGKFQKINAGAAIKASEVLKKKFGFSINKDKSLKGLLAKNWIGRLERFNRSGAKIILDGAHNPISVKCLLESFELKNFNRNTWLVFGAMNDKNSHEMLKIFSRKFKNVILTTVAGSRAKPVSLLTSEAKGLFSAVIPSKNVEEAFCFLVAIKPKMVVVAGSFYLVGEARKILKSSERDSGKV